MSHPKAVIFDLGGVLITSPLKAIEECETENDIPHGYLNYAM
jgi:FMN phosphatase YigB (HAD superfamily)